MQPNKKSPTKKQQLNNKANDKSIMWSQDCQARKETRCVCTRDCKILFLLIKHSALWGCLIDPYTACVLYVQETGKARHISESGCSFTLIKLEGIEPHRGMNEIFKERSETLGRGRGWVCLARGQVVLIRSRMALGCWKLAPARAQPGADEARDSVFGHGACKPRQEKTGQLQGKWCNSGGFCEIRGSRKLSFSERWSLIREWCWEQCWL